METGLSPCEAEGGCPLWEYCKEYNQQCDSFRHYLNGHPRLGVDKDAEKKRNHYRFHTDRGENLKTITD